MKQKNINALKETYHILYDVMKVCHPRSYERRFEQYIKKCSTTKTNLRSRAIASKTRYSLSLQELRDLIAEHLYTACKYCGETITLDTLNIDHIVPMSANGATEISNLQVICKKCNTRKSSLSDSEYRKFIEIINAYLQPSTVEYILSKMSSKSYRG